MTQLDRIEEKLDKLLHILEGGKTTYAIQQQAKKVVQFKLEKIREKELKNKEYERAQTG